MGRKLLDAQAKAANRRAALQRYANKNREGLREAARARMERLRSVEGVLESRRKARASAEAYREKNRAKIRAADAARRERKRAAAEATEQRRRIRSAAARRERRAADEAANTRAAAAASVPRPRLSRFCIQEKGASSNQQPPLTITTVFAFASVLAFATVLAVTTVLTSGCRDTGARRREARAGRSPLAKKRIARTRASLCSLGLADKRCRMLRRCGLEDDNGEDSDADLPLGMCGCDNTMCFKIHKNESFKRLDWKRFHLEYPDC
ncbi:hypothetical protein C8F04DRAFT_1270014 [Mycena alexandri]|uniref:Uncharacterized protein n=1 Tax=Mycena alexandri TaxID=1745969 RepID=A0AAD6WXF0_9AGAR|nr:hypothetical protein C8F04DRAFT_1270014 [Mycena alexandri]